MTLLEWRIVLLVVAVLCLCGLGALLWTVTYIFLRRGRESLIRTVVVVFATVGLLISAGITVAALGDRVVPDAIGYAFPTALVVGNYGEYGDPTWYVAMLIAASILSNVGLYGVVGLGVGGIWEWTRRRGR